MTTIFVAVQPRETDPDFYLKDSYWKEYDGVRPIEKAVVWTSLRDNLLSQKIILEAKRRGIPVVVSDPENRELVRELAEFLSLQGAA